MSHFLGTPSHSRVWALKHSENLTAWNCAKESRKRLLSGPTVDIYVGKERKHWSLHENLLCHHSSYFETEFQGHEVPKKEHQPSHNSLELPDDDPHGFELLVKWLYQGHLDDASHMTDEDKYDYAVACHKLYKLCDKFDMIQVKNLAMDSYRQNLHAAQLVPDAEEINDIYRASPRGSPFRKLMTKIAARQIMDPGVDKDAETYRACFDGNPDFAVDMVNEIRHMSGGMLFDDPTKEDECMQWHDHRDGSRCHLKSRGNVYANQGAHRTPKSSAMKKAQQTPMAELSARPTPRKLNVPNQPPATPRTPSTKRPPTPKGSATQQSSAKAAKPSTEGKADAVSASAQSPKTKVKSDLSEASHRPNGLKRVTIRPHPSSRLYMIGTEPSTTSSTAAPSDRLTNGHESTSDQASSTTSAPRKMSHVNGMVLQLDGINGSSAPSLADTNDANVKKAPPKLKRKAPG
ncbi:uncharacterized protein LTR77_000543 [Saxophila tyrrhenica]|uniref:BTB domain-containing protein n=1 Tax=Saxophila tyrrhenica TaxID=1690608 RepID=A0AAV9PQX7_9PEZI|nr:hypothetical protein LTR77_000543 [Saxophila tyrrhenica]